MDIENDSAAAPTSAGTSVISRARTRDEFEVWELVRRRRGYIFAGIVIGAMLGTVYALFGSPKFLATVELVVVEKNPHLPAQGAKSSGDIEGQVSSKLLSTHVEIMKSKRVVEEALKRVGPDVLKSIENRRRSWESPVEYVIRKMTVEHGGEESADEGANVLRVTFEHSKADESATILAAVLGCYREFVSETFEQVSDKAINLIKQVKSDLETDLQHAEAEYVEFLKHSPLMWSGEVESKGDKKPNIPQQRVTTIEERLATLNVKQIETRSRLKALEDALESDPNGKPETYGLALLSEDDLKRVGFYVDVHNGDAGRSEAFQTEQAKRVEAMRAEYDRKLSLLMQEVELGSKVGKDHSKMRRLNDQKVAVASFLETHAPRDSATLPDRPRPEAVLNAYMNMLRSDLVELDSRREEYESLQKHEMTAAKEIVSFEVRGEQMRESMDRKRQLFNAAMDRLRDTMLIKEYGGYVTEVITPVERGKLYWLGLIEGNPLLCAILSIVAGAFIGGCMGSVGGVVRHLVDDTFGRADEVEHELKMPILAHVDQDQLAKTTNGRTGANAGIVSNGAIADGYRELRNSLSLLLSKRGVRVLQVVSPGGAKETRSELVANLAVAFAQVGRKTLVIDCDLQNRKVSQQFGFSRETGLADLLTGRSDWSQSVKSTSCADLSILPAGALGESNTDLWLTPAFKDVMERARNEFALVLIDCPALSRPADAVALASHSDAALLALRIGRNERLATIRARDVLTNLGVDLLGAVVIGADTQGGIGYRELKATAGRRAATLGH